jgi:hypothetical protein
MDASADATPRKLVLAAALLLVVGSAWPAPGPTQGRVEQTDPSVAYSGTWTQSASQPWSGGTAALSMETGAQVVFTFTGPSVSWIGGRTPDTGIAHVYLDGIFLAEVDTFSKTDEIRVPMFAVHGLTDAGHTLTIEVTGRKNEASTSALVVVDAFDVPAATISRLQETDPAVTYSAGWVQDNPVVTLIPGLTTGRTQGYSLRAWSAGAATLSATPGAQAAFKFTGTAITWVGARGTQSGIARVFLDGSFVSEVDMYAPIEQIQADVFTATGLADTSHTLTIEVTGRKNHASETPLIVVDAFDVTSSGTRYQETHSSIAYTTGWIQGNRDKAYSEGTTAESVTPGAQATFTFTGTSVSWIGARGPQTGIARVYLDRVLVDRMDMYSPTEAPQKTVFTASDLPEGIHTLTIEVTGEKNPASTDTWVLVDAFDVRP